MNPYMTTLKETLEQKGVGASSLKQYFTTLRTLAGGDFTNLDFLNDSKAVIEKISKVGEKKASQNTIYNKMTGIRSVLQATGHGGDELYDAYKGKAESIKNKLTQASASGVMTEKEKAAWMTPEEIASVLDNVKKRAMCTQSRQDVTDYLILALYCILPPRRVLDYAMMCMIRGKAPKVLNTNVNWFIVDEGRMIFNVHKNATVTGTEYNTNAKDSDAFQDALKLYLSTLPALSKSAKMVQQPLIQHVNGTAYNEAAIRKTLYRLLKPGCGASMIRKIYATAAAPDKESLEKIIARAKSMGHDLQTHIRHYIKNEIV